MERMTTAGIHGVRCELCGHGTQRGIDAWQVNGETRILCYLCAAILLAVAKGWRPAWLFPV
jgi:hypothetical protein